MAMTSRLARLDKVAGLEPLVDAAIETLQKGFLDDDQIAANARHHGNQPAID